MASLKGPESTIVQSRDQSSEPEHPTRSRPRSLWHKFRAYIWDDPDKPKDEKWFLFKLDAFFLTISCLGYFSKNLDQANVSNAYVSGMKEALHMYGSELTYAGNCFTAGYVLGQLPAVMLARRVRPSILIPTAEILWSIFTFAASAIKTPGHLYAIRFLVGLCESVYFPTVVYALGSWYSRSERGKRLTIFYSTTAMSQMFSGYLQAAAYKGLNGVAGRQGWQWLFIICGVIGLPIGIAGYFCYPDFPETTRAFYLTAKEVEFARARLRREGLKPLGASKWDRKKIFRIARHWQFWLLPLGYFFVQGSLPAYQPVFALWLKATKHTVYQVNVWPTGQPAVGLVVQILAGMVSDSPLLRGKRWQVILVMQAVTLFGAVVLAVWNVPKTLKFVAYYLLYFSQGVPGIWYAWYVDLIPNDHEFRGFVIAASNMFSFLQSLWFTIAVWRTVEAPKFRPGFIFASVLGVAIISLSLIIRVLQSRDERKRAEQADTFEDSVEASITTPQSGGIADGAVASVYKGEAVSTAYP